MLPRLARVIHRFGSRATEGPPDKRARRRCSMSPRWRVSKGFLNHASNQVVTKCKPLAPRWWPPPRPPELAFGNANAWSARQPPDNCDCEPDFRQIGVTVGPALHSHLDNSNHRHKHDEIPEPAGEGPRVLFLPGNRQEADRD